MARALRSGSSSSSPPGVRPTELRRLIERRVRSASDRVCRGFFTGDGDAAFMEARIWSANACVGDRGWSGEACIGFGGETVGGEALGGDTLR